MLKGIQSIKPAREDTELGPENAAQQSVGDMLRTQREEYGLDLREISGALRIRYPYLLAIEESRLDDLPGATYAVGFVRAYAEHLGFDGAAVVERYKDETAALANAARLVFPSPLPEGKVPSGTILVFAVLALGVIYGGWLLLSSDNRTLAELVPALPDRFMTFIGMSAKTPPDTIAANPNTEPAQATPPNPVVTPAIPQEPETAAANAAPEANAAPPEPGDAPRPAPPQAAEAPREAAPSAESATPATVPEEPRADQIAAALPDAAPAVEARSAAPEAAETTPAPLVQSEGLRATVQDAVAAPPGNSEPETTTENQRANIDPVDREPADTARQQVDATAESAPETANPESADENGDQRQNVVAAVENLDATAAGSGDPASRVDDAPVSNADISASVAQPLAPPPAPSAGPKKPRQYGAQNTDARVVIRATDESWVQVRDKDGNLLLTRVLRVGDSYRVPNDAGLVMRTGNAGGLDIQVDGESVPELGPKGAIRHDVALDAERLKAGTAIRR